MNSQLEIQAKEYSCLCMCGCCDHGMDIVVLEL